VNQKLIFLPLLAQVLLTAWVSFRLAFTRVAEMKRKHVHPQKISTSAGVNQQLSDSLAISDNFSNQFETPVAFYALVIILYVTGMANTTNLVMGSAFVALRYLHSFIHCGYNNVIHRFYVFIAGTVLLWVLWLLFAIELMRSP